MEGLMFRHTTLRQEWEVHYLLTARRDDDGSFRLVGHPAILQVLWSVPGALKKIIRDPSSNSRAAKRLFPDAYTDPDAQAEHERLLGDDLKNSQLSKVSAFEKVLEDSGQDSDEIHIPANKLDGFLAVLTDLRLVLAVDLEIEDDDWEQQLTDENLEDPRIHLLNLLAAMQQLLLESTGLVDIELDPDDLADQ